MKKKYTFILSIFLIIGSLSAQVSDNLWSESSVLKKESFKKVRRDTLPKEYKIFQLNLELLKDKLVGVPLRNQSTIKSNTIISFPDEKGVLQKFRIFEASIMEEGLQKKYPGIKSYIGNEIDNPNSSIRFSVSDLGLNALILGGSGSTTSLEPYTADKRSYIIYSNKNLPRKVPFECGAQDKNNNNPEKRLKASIKNANDSKLRTYRLAVTATGEHSQWVLEDQGIASNATEEIKKETVLSSIVATMTNVNAIFERDLSLTMVLVANNSKIIFLNPDNDNLSGSYNYKLINENQTVVNDLIGINNYDIGHVFTADVLDVPGVAYLPSVCKINKAGGASSARKGIWTEEVILHEMGHQFGASHTFNNCGGSGGGSEPGCGGRTGSLMSYSHNAEYPYFHLSSIQQIWNHITSDQGSCAALTEINNSSPILENISNYSLPISTPFILKAVASDSEGDKLTYTFEQLDNEQVPLPLVSTATVGPAFETLPPSAESKRYFPSISSVINGQLSNPSEVLPSVSRSMLFGINVRDNNILGGQTQSIETEITFHANSGPFTLTYPSSDAIWEVGSNHEITWDVANTNNSPINCSKVNILLSIDGGYTYPFNLATDVENDGSHNILVPDVSTHGAKVKIESLGNIFYTMNIGYISINPPAGKTFVPDNNFELALIDLGHDNVLDDYVKTDNINKITSLSIDNKNIAILKGIEGFKNLTMLTCSRNNLNKLDLSSNKDLESLNCWNNNLTYLDVSKNIALEYLQCHDNYLTNLDVSNLSKLTNLNCYGNNLSTINVANNKALWNLSCSRNILTNLDISNNTLLTDLVCSSNNLEILDISKNSALIRLWCDNNSIASLDVSKNTELNDLRSYNNITNCIQVNQNQLDSYANVWLKDDDASYSLNCEGDDDNDGVNNFTDHCPNTPSGETSDNNGCSISQKTYVPDNKFEQVLIDLNYDNMLDGYVITNKIEEISVIDVNGLGVQSLEGIEDFIALKELICWNNDLEALDVSNNIELNRLICHRNSITTIELSNNIKLNELMVADNYLTDLDVSNNTELKYLLCQNNKLETLDLSKNSSLIYLACDSNKLTRLNVDNGNNLNFEYFRVFDNPNLTCIQVDNASYSTVNWTNIDSGTSFSENCQYIILGVEDEILSASLKIYPNPVADVLTVESKLQLKSTEIYNLLGQEIKIVNDDFESINLNDLSRGIYMIKIHSENGSTVRKLIKQ